MLEFKIVNETHFMIYEENEISLKTKTEVISIVNTIQKMNHPAIKNINESYRSIMIEYDNLNYEYEDLIREIQLNTRTTLSNDVEHNSKVVRIPVLYGNEYGPDLSEVAEHANLTAEEVIRIHSNETYLIYAIGFLPGFPFLGGLDERIHTPRKETPRSKIVAGSVGIANNQTGLYPKDSPGGWQIIGRTPIDVFNLKRDPMVLYEAGDYIQFESIDIEKYKKIQSEILNETFEYSKLVGEMK